MSSRKLVIARHSHNSTAHADLRYLRNNNPDRRYDVKRDRLGLYVVVRILPRRAH